MLLKPNQEDLEGLEKHLFGDSGGPSLSSPPPSEEMESCDEQHSRAVTASIPRKEETDRTAKQCARNSVSTKEEIQNAQLQRERQSTLSSRG